MTGKTSLEIIILAAGRGKRMKSARPKVLHTLGGRPLLEHLLTACMALHADKIHVVVGHEKEQLIAWLNQWQEVKSTGKRKASATKVQWVEQTTQLGTGHAVMQALAHCDKRSTVLVMNGDTPLVLPTTLRKITRLVAAMNLMTVTLETPGDMGRIVRDADGNVARIVEYKDASAAQKQICEVNTNCLCARASDLLSWLQQVKPHNAQKEYYLTDATAVAVAGGNRIKAVSPAHLWESFGVNSKSDLAVLERVYQQQQAEKMLQAGVTLFDPARVDVRGTCTFGMDCSVDVNVIFAGAVRVGHAVTIGPNTLICNSVIADGTVIEANSVIDNARIGKNCRIGPFARIRPQSNIADEVKIGNFVETKNSVIKRGSKVNHLSYVGDSAVGRNVNIGAGVITCNYDGANKHQTIIGDEVFVGSGAQLVAPLKIAAGATIGAGSTITDDVAKSALAVSRGRQRSIKKWQRPKKK